MLFMKMRKFVTAMMFVAVLLLTISTDVSAQQLRQQRDLNDPAEIERQISDAKLAFQQRDERVAKEAIELAAAGFVADTVSDPTAPTVKLFAQGGIFLAVDGTFVRPNETVRLSCQKSDGTDCLVASWSPSQGLRTLATNLMGFIDLAPTEPTSIAAFVVLPDGRTAAATMLLQTATKDGTIAVCDGAIAAKVGTAIKLYNTHNLAGLAEYVLPDGSMPTTQVGFALNTTVLATGLKAYIGTGHQDNRSCSCAIIVDGLPIPRAIGPTRGQ